MYKASKRLRGSVAVAQSPSPDPAPSEISGDAKALNPPESGAAKLPESKADPHVVGVRSPSTTVVATQAGPGRPPKKPRCLRCGRKLHLCKCSKGSLLAKQVEQAVEQAESSPKNKFSKEEAEQILRMALYCLGLVESGIASVVSRMTWNEAQQVWSYDEKEVALLLPPATRVLAKYADKIPVLFTKYKDEMALAWALMQVTNAKITRSVEVIAKRAASETAAHSKREESREKSESAAPAVKSQVAAPAQVM